MDIESLREYCLSFPGTTDIIQWEHDLLFKVGGKMFAATSIDPPHDIGFKCSEEDFDMLVEREGIVPSPYLAKHKWVRCETLTTVPARELKVLIAKSYQLVHDKLPKKVQREIAESK